MKIQPLFVFGKETFTFVTCDEMYQFLFMTIKEILFCMDAVRANFK